MRTDDKSAVTRGFDGVTAYVDGSFDSKAQIYSYGAVLLSPEGSVLAELCGKGEDESAKKEWNIAGELLGAMTAIKWAYQNGYRKIMIKHDYDGIGKWAAGQWRAKGFCATEYVEFLAKFRTQMEIVFEKVPAHSGVFYNEIADKLAKQGLEA